MGIRGGGAPPVIPRVPTEFATSSKRKSIRGDVFMVTRVTAGGKGVSEGGKWILPKFVSEEGKSVTAESL